METVRSGECLSRSESWLWVFPVFPWCFSVCRGEWRSSLGSLLASITSDYPHLPSIKLITMQWINPVQSLISKSLLQPLWITHVCFLSLPVTPYTMSSRSSHASAQFTHSLLVSTINPSFLSTYCSCLHLGPPALLITIVTFSENTLWQITHWECILIGYKMWHIINRVLGVLSLQEMVERSTHLNF